MKAKANEIDFLAFNDGVCVIENQQYRFGRRTMSFSRHFAARAAGIKADRLIHIPYTENIYADDKVEIGEEIFRVEQAQPTKATCPPCTVLTLRRYGVNGDDD